MPQDDIVHVEILYQTPLNCPRVNAEGEDWLTPQVEELRIIETCDCGDDFCQSFYTRPKPVGAYGDGHRNVCLNAPWPGYLVLDVVHDDIRHVEVLYRPPLC